jgi:hypothetical protein
MEVYLLDRATAAYHQRAMLAVIAATFVACASLAYSLGRRGWWLTLIAILIVPTVVALAFGARLDGPTSPLAEMVLPLALVLGLPSGTAGVLTGAAGRFWRRRRKG